MAALEQQLASNATRPLPRMSTKTSTESVPDDEVDFLQPATTQLYEGDSSFTRQSILTGDVAQATAVHPSLGRLSTLLQTPGPSSVSSQYRFSKSTNMSSHIANLEPLPMDLVLAILQEIKGQAYTSGPEPCVS